MILVCLALTGCQLNGKPDAESIKDNLIYFRDEKTGLCFAAVNSMSSKSLSNSSSIACVPCDSLKRVEVK